MTIKHGPWNCLNFINHVNQQKNAQSDRINPVTGPVLSLDRP